MVFWETQVICCTFVQECERAGRKGVPGIRGNQIESGLQLWNSWRSLFLRNHINNQPNKQPEFCPINNFVPDSDEVNGCGDTIDSSHANLDAIRSSGRRRSLPRSRRGASILLAKKAAPVSLFDLF